MIQDGSARTPQFRKCLDKGNPASQGQTALGTIPPEKRFVTVFGKDDQRNSQALLVLGANEIASSYLLAKDNKKNLL